jgi:hypothetical protein
MSRSFYPTFLISDKSLKKYFQKSMVVSIPFFARPFILNGRVAPIILAEADSGGGYWLSASCIWTHGTTQGKTQAKT